MSESSESFGTSRRQDDSTDSPSSRNRAPGAKPRRYVGSSADYINPAPEVPGVSERHEQPAPTDESPPAPEPIPVRDTDPTDLPDPSLISFTVTHETLVLAALVLSSLLLASFIFGHKVGKHRALSNVAEPIAAMIPSEQKSKLTLDPVKTPVKTAKRSANALKEQIPKPPREKKAEVWTLCVISYKISQRAKADNLVTILSDWLSDKKIDQKVFLKRSANAYTVCVGYFDSSRDRDLAALVATMRQVTFMEEQPFKDCYPTKLQG